MGTEGLGGYERWSEVIGGILKVAGIPGFLADRDRVYEEADEELTVWTEFCSAWWEEFHNRDVTSDRLFGLVTVKGLLLEMRSGRDDHGARTAFGKALSKMRDRVVGGFRIRRSGVDAHTKAVTYRLEVVQQPSGRTPSTIPAGVAGVRGGSSGSSFEASTAVDAPDAPSADSNRDAATPATPANPRGRAPHDPDDGEQEMRRWTY